MQGVYKITNKLTGQVYIGQSMDIENRWRQHIWRSSCPSLCEDMCEYGVENFTFEVLEEIKSEEGLRVAEAYWIMKYMTRKVPMYNKSYPHLRDEAYLTRAAKVRACKRSRRSNP